ncbi:MAG: hypothetical protein JWO09_2674 [Bacteroidetes bacterium]|nr:hypothetical protein [Bacteroidota bacterium]
MNRAIFAFIFTVALFSFKQEGASQYEKSCRKAFSQLGSAQLKGDDKDLFKALFSKRTGSGLLKRLDSLNYNYVFISESFNKADSSYFIKEIYYRGKLPVYIYYDGQQMLNENVIVGLNKEYFEFEDECMRGIKAEEIIYSKYKAFQEAAYDDSPLMYYTGEKPGRAKVKEYARALEEKIANTYKIFSRVSKPEKSFTFSFQVPPSVIIIEPKPSRVFVDF